MIQFFCPRWGSERIEWKEWLQQVKAVGYDGIEWAIANTTSVAEIEKVFRLAEKQNIPVIAQHYETNASDFQQHYNEYAQWFEKIKSFPAVKINSQTGKDYFNFEENKQLIELADSYAVTIPIVHETHRGKFSFAAHITREYLERISSLKITLDASHWVCVAESLLEDQALAMAMAIERTDHIHARVGHAEGPQVPDPRVQEWKEALNKHLGWWDQVVARHRAEKTTLTITTEFGPFPYMVTIPGTEQPIADQWQVNLYMMQLLKERYA